MKRIDAILWAALFLLTLALVGGADAAVEIEDDTYLNYGTWVHATNTGGGHEASARPILWQKAAATPHLFCSVYLVEAHAWDTSGRVPDGGWTESDMYLWLNGFSAAESSSFYSSAFSSSEKNGLRADPDGDIGSRITLPDVCDDYARPSRFGVAKYRGSGNLEYWLRRPYSDTAGTDDAWGVGGAGNEGLGVVSRVLGVRPLIELDLPSFLFRSGSGTQAAPYELYRGDGRMKPISVVLKGSELRLDFPVPIAAFGSLPDSTDFTFVRNEQARRQRLAAVIGVDIPAGNPNELRLTLSEAALFRDSFNLSYALPRTANGTLAGGALVAAGGERIALAPFDDLSVANETPPTTADILLVPSAVLSTPVYRRFDTVLSVSSTRPAATVSLDDVRKTAGLDENLAVTWDSASSALEIHGVPTIVGRHTLHLDVTVDGAEISNVPVTVDILSQNSLAGIEVTPSVPGPIELRAEADVTYTVGSTVADASVELLSASQDTAWEQSGLALGSDLASRTFHVTGTPVRTGIFPVYLRVRIDGRESEQQYDIEVVYPAANPTPGDLRVTSDLVGPIPIGRPVRFTYTVGSSVRNAEVALRRAATGEDWSDTGLYLQPDLANRQFMVWGIPTAAGNYTMNVEALIDGASLPIHVESFTVGTPPNAKDVTFIPEIPRGRTCQPYRATTTVGSAIAGELTSTSPLPNAQTQRMYDTTTEAASRSGQFVTLYGVSADKGWSSSGLLFSTDESTREIAISGTPQAKGVDSLLADLAIASTHIEDESLMLVVDAPASKPTPKNIVAASNQMESSEITVRSDSSGCTANAFPLTLAAIAALVGITGKRRR